MKKEQLETMAKVLLSKAHQDALEKAKSASERLEVTEGGSKPYPTHRQPKRAIYGGR